MLSGGASLHFHARLESLGVEGIKSVRVYVRMAQSEGVEEILAAVCDHVTDENTM